MSHFNDPRPDVASGSHAQQHPNQHSKQTPGPGARQLACALMAAALLLTGRRLEAQTEPNRRRGDFLRTDTVRTETQPSFTCALVHIPSSFTTLRFRKQERITRVEVAVYEVLVPEEPEAADAEFEAIAYRVAAGEEMRGDITTRTVDRDAGPCANAQFEIGDTTITTDDKGFFVDRKQTLLRPFDDLRVNTWTTQVRHQDLGTVPLTLSRYLTRRWKAEDSEAKSRLIQDDILKAAGLDYEPLSRSDHSGVRVTVDTPEQIKPGEDIIIKISVINTGSQTVSCLLGRLFSRHNWLSGANLYIGNLPPGKTQAFERMLTVPETIAEDQPIYAALGFWDIRGPIKGGARRISLLTKPPAP